MTLAARLVHAGIVPRPRAEAVLKERDSLRGQIAAPSLLDLLVNHGLITRTELMIFRDRPLEDRESLGRERIRDEDGGHRLPPARCARMRPPCVRPSPAN